MSTVDSLRTPEDIDDYRRRLALSDQEFEAAMRDTLDTKGGRHLIWWVLANAHIYKLSYKAGEEARTGFMEGQRSIGLQLLAEIERICPNRYQQMKDEALERSRRYDHSGR